MPVVESAIGGIAWSIIETAGKAGKYVVAQGKEAYKDVQHKQRVLAASEAYIQHYLNRHCQIKIMPGLMKAPLDLNSIYTDVKLLDNYSIRRFAGIQELEEGFRAKGSRGFGAGEAKRVRGIEVANREPFLTVLGGPGIGKSTFLRKIGLEALKREGDIQRECIPVFLELKKFKEKTVNIQKEIVKELDICKFPSTEALVESALEQGKLLVLFDGLDEVPVSNLNTVIERIEDFVDKYSQNSFVASCRVAAYRSSFRRFVDVTIAEFDDEQIEQFIYRWFGSQEDEELGIAEKYLELLNQPEHKATKELAQTPLLLTFLCLLYDRKQMLPSKRSTLYGRALDIILDEWSAQKRIDRDPIHERLNPDLEKILLADIAYESFSQDQLFFSKETITDRIAGFLSDTLENPKYLNADAVLTAIEVQQGILVERATDAYSFSHLTLQEYLAALHIVENQLEGNLVSEHLTDESWHEVFLLTSGLMNNRALQLLAMMEKQVKTYIQPYEKVKALVQWAAINKVGESKLYHRAAMMAIASASVSDSDSSISASVNAIIIATLSDSNSVSDSNNVSVKSFHSFSVGDSFSVIAVARANSVSVITSDSEMASARATDSVRAIAIAVTIDSEMADTRAIDSATVRTIVRAIAIDSGNSHHFLNAQSMEAIADKLSDHRNIIPESTTSFEKWRHWANQLQLIWLEALELDQDAITFSIEEAKALKNYLYATELLIRCKESAIRISRSEWKALEARLLTI